MRKNGKTILAVLIILCVAAMVCVYVAFGNNGGKTAADTKENVTQAETESEDTAQQKSIVISVVYLDGETTSYELTTDAQYLSGAMEQAEGLTFSGTQGPYGIMLEEVNGVSAVYEEDGAYWSVLVDGEYGMYGIDTQPVEDGVHYSLVYTLA